MQKIKVCKKCGAQMDKSAKSCPQCGAPAKGKKGLIIGAVVVFIVLVAAIGNAEDNSSKTEPITPAIINQLLRSGTLKADSRSLRQLKTCTF